MSKIFVSSDLSNLDSFSEIIKNGVSYLFREAAEDDTEHNHSAAEVLKKNFITSGAFDGFMPTIVSEINHMMVESGKNAYYGNYRSFGDKSYAPDGRLWYIMAWSRDNKIPLLHYSPNLREFASQRAGKAIEAIASHPYRSWYYNQKMGHMMTWVDMELSLSTEECSPSQILSKRYLSKSKVEDFSLFDVSCFDSIVARNPKLAQEVVEDTSFNKRFDSGARGPIYTSLARYNALTTKIARKIRSDTSERASGDGIFSILTNWNKITNPQAYISQCVDTNYPDIALRLAKEIPIQFVTFMAGSQHNHAREEAVRRMDQLKDGGANV